MHTYITYSYIHTDGQKKGPSKQRQHKEINIDKVVEKGNTKYRLEVYTYTLINRKVQVYLTYWRFSIPYFKVR